MGANFEDLLYKPPVETPAKPVVKKKLNNAFVKNDTIKVDGIPHFDITKYPLKRKTANAIEDDFKDILSMKYMKYIYERDGYWRTWREIKYPDGKKKIISYKSQSIVPINGSECDNRGTWVIEEGNPPCPFELLSVINSAELCAINYLRLKEQHGPCPSIIKFMDLTGTCSNPIVTRWRISRDYTVSGRFKNKVCGGRDFCDIVTLYQIRPQDVIFRIINESNIIYSRVMRSGKKNYACVEQCGDINLKTFRVTPSKLNEKPNKKNKNWKIKNNKNKNKEISSKVKDIGKRIATLNVKGKTKKLITINSNSKNNKMSKNPLHERLRVDNFYNSGVKQTRAPIMTITKAHYKKIVGKHPHESEVIETYYDTYETEEKPEKNINNYDY
ncbi:uncharacterized protein LOC126379715 [Pectinophora gossypiella]|uniref:uncharacterized protein LOC126379715 n=1 Tax=Pectinophora gossypiella TaxID=13191 RepID=UPI00214E9190|nr:uncharacterized protein LOC126379715 [Pectinophora gossypiella]